MAGTAQANGPAGKRSYLTFRGEVVSSYFEQPAISPAGFSIDWGLFQNAVVATGTRLGVSRSDPVAGDAILFGGGPQFHLALGRNFLLIPGFSFATRISERAFGFAGYLNVAAAFRHEVFYTGLEVEAPAFLQSFQGFELFPRAFSMNALIGFYY